MSRIIGTIINLKKFFSNLDAELIAEGEKGKSKAFSLKKDRKYIIPSFQRELRWEKKQVIELIRDISESDKFLGNIILDSELDKNSFLIIDGQQRITILYMILDFLKKKFGEDIDILNNCELVTENFTTFNILKNNNYSIDDINENNLRILEEGDLYSQKKKYVELYEEIISSEFLNSKTKAIKFYDHLCKSNFNLIISDDDMEKESIQYFLDVNLKGLKLDNEDIFKGYLFSLGCMTEMKPLWTKFKQHIIRINNGDLTFKNYSLCDFLQHFMYCYIYKDEKYKEIKFGNDFLISNDVEIGGDKYFAGEHIVKVINSNSFFKNMFTEMNNTLAIIGDIIQSPTGVPNSLKILLKNGNIDSSEYDVISNYLAKILLGDKVIFKSLVVKYILTLTGLTNDISYNKKQIKDIYAIILYINLYLILKNKKDIVNIIPILKENSIHNKIMEEIVTFTSGSYPIGNYAVSINENNESDQRYNAQILASIYNFYQIKGDKVVIRGGNFEKLKNYLSDKNNFSIEHFLINASGKFLIFKSNENQTILYNKQILKNYKNSIFNFIFIPRDINNDIENFDINRKIDILKSNLNNIKCDFSKMFIKEAEGLFPDLSQKFSASNDLNADINRYYNYDFMNEYNHLVIKIMVNLMKRIKE